MSKQWVESRKTVVLDFNGVLDTYRGWKGPDFMYPPAPGVGDFLKALVESGWTLVVMTAADPHDVRQWLDEYKLSQYISKVTSEKVPAVVYLDDRGITFTGNFQLALTQINNFKTFWETPQHHEGGKL